MERELEKISDKELKELLEYNRAYAASDGVKGSPVDLRRTDLRGYDFRGYDLRYVDFSQSDLRGANFTGVDIRHAHFTGVNLAGARGIQADIIKECHRESAILPRRVHVKVFGELPPKPSGWPRRQRSRAAHLG